MKMSENDTTVGLYRKPTFPSELVKLDLHSQNGRVRLQLGFSAMAKLLSWSNWDSDRKTRISWIRK